MCCPQLKDALYTEVFPKIYNRVLRQAQDVPFNYALGKCGHRPLYKALRSEPALSGPTYVGSVEGMLPVFGNIA